MAVDKAGFEKWHNNALKEDPTMSEKASKFLLQKKIEHDFYYENHFRYDLNISLVKIRVEICDVNFNR